MHEVLERLARFRLLPVVTIDEAERAQGLAQALIDGGLACMEVTLRSDAAEESLRRVAAIGSEILVGAGTVLDADQAERAVAAGARFLVSPGLNEELARAAQDLGVPLLPGVATATEVMAARRLGFEVVKLFPAEALGGIAVMKALSAPFPQMRFVPTGGVNADNVNAWLARPEVPFCGGSWMVPRELLARGDFDGIRALVEQAVEQAAGQAGEQAGAAPE